MLLACVSAASGQLTAQPSLQHWSARAVARTTDESSDGGLGVTMAIVRARDGSLVVAHPFESVIRIYAPDGKFVRKLGRPGDGPAEFRSVDQMGWKADTLWVYDRLRHVISYWNITGRYLRSERDPAANESPRRFQFAGLLAGNNIITQSVAGPANSPALTHTEIRRRGGDAIVRLTSVGRSTVRIACSSVRSASRACYITIHCLQSRRGETTWS